MGHPVSIPPIGMVPSPAAIRSSILKQIIPAMNPNLRDHLANERTFLAWLGPASR